MTVEGSRPGTDDTVLERLGGWIDERTGFETFVRTALRKLFPDHWSFLLGEIAVFSFVILVATGVFLTFFYVPSEVPVEYQGPYVPLRGQEVSVAFDSVMRLSWEVQAGLLIRQTHHWTALVFVAVIIAHLCRVFFTGAFRRPREINWMIGLTLLALALAEGVTGYSLPDDLLSGTGLRIVYSIVLSIPFLGPTLAYLLFGGEFPASETLTRLFALHVMALPVILGGLIGLHLLLVWIQLHTQFPGPGRTDRNVVGKAFWPYQVLVSTALLLFNAGALLVLGGVAQINPVWDWGPFDPSIVSSPAQPDWYAGWLEGGLRLFPPVEPTLFGITFPTPFIPGVVLPFVLFTIVGLWPLLEQRVTGDRDVHNLLQLPWEAPGRTAFGAAVIAFCVILTLAGGDDVLAHFLSIDLETLVWILRGLVVVGPIVVWFAAYRLALGAQSAEREAQSRPPGHGEAGVPIGRTSAGGFEELSE